MPRRRGRPGLVGTMARTAVVAGTATVVAKGVSGAMGGGKGDTQPAPAQAPQVVYAEAPPAPGSSGPTPEDLATIEKLAALKESGAITDEEFVVQKAKILGSF